MVTEAISDGSSAAGLRARELCIRAAAEQSHKETEDEGKEEHWAQSGALETHHGRLLLLAPEEFGSPWVSWGARVQACRNAEPFHNTARVNKKLCFEGSDKGIFTASGLLDTRSFFWEW